MEKIFNICDYLLVPDELRIINHYDELKCINDKLSIVFNKINNEKPKKGNKKNDCAKNEEIKEHENVVYLIRKNLEDNNYIFNDILKKYKNKFYDYLDNNNIRDILYPRFSNILTRIKIHNLQINQNDYEIEALNTKILHLKSKLSRNTINELYIPQNVIITHPLINVKLDKTNDEFINHMYNEMIINDYLIYCDMKLYYSSYHRYVNVINLYNNALSGEIKINEIEIIIKYNFITLIKELKLSCKTIMLSIILLKYILLIFEIQHMCKKLLNVALEYYNK